MIILICGPEHFSHHITAEETSQDRILMMMTMKSGPSGLFLLLLLTSSASGLGSVVSKAFYYHSVPYTWQEAQSFCRSHYVDLATIYTQADKDSWNINKYYAWIGLHKQPYSNSYYWYWSNREWNDYYHWAQNEPGNSGSCAVVNYDNKRFYDANCDEHHFFICDKMKTYREYTFVPQSKTWSEAREYCRTNFDDLATIRGDSQRYRAVKQRDYPVWTGLYRDGGTFKWSSGVSEYLDWASDEPGNNGDCVSILSKQKKMEIQNCSAGFPVICMSDNLVLVKENKTWEEALEHCRGLDQSNEWDPQYELLSVQPGEDHMYVVTTAVQGAVTEKVWTGLRFLAGKWLWINKADQLYSDLPICPNMKHHCGALSKNDNDQIEPTDCSEKLNFLCYKR